MLAYKFRSPNQIAYSFDALFNNRLYCADWETLNDPVESIFGYNHLTSTQTDYSKVVTEIEREMKKLRVCSLSKTFDCHLLWAHYASGFSGLAIEVEIPDQAEEIKHIHYGGVFSLVSMENRGTASDIAESVLTSKYQEWAYEQEVRILSDKDWYQLATPVKRIIAGHRMNPALFQALQTVCAWQKVPFSVVGIGDEGIDADSVLPLDE